MFEYAEVEWSVGYEHYGALSKVAINPETQ